MQLLALRGTIQNLQTKIDSKGAELVQQDRSLYLLLLLFNAKAIVGFMTRERMNMQLLRWR